MDNKNTDINYADFQAREKSIAIGKRYLNLFHQLHVIKAGLEALNKDFISLPDNVLEILPELSGGAKFFQHIKNLKDGSTPMNKIDADLLPFGKDVFENEDLFHKYTDYVHKSNVESVPSTPSSSSVNIMTNDIVDNDNKVIFDLLRSFQATPQYLENFQSEEAVKDLGPNWKVEIGKIIDRSSEKDKSLLKKNFENLCVFSIALNIWQECLALLKNPRSKSKQEIKSNLEKYNKYLSMFGEKGKELYGKVETLAG